MATLLYDGLQYWYSPENWHSPIDGLRAQPSKWEYLGSEGWAIKREHHKRREEVFALFGDNIPEWPNEYSQIEIMP